ncbi:hypothetical protein POM88_048136 [Heracleum sosnowskyi]|uniref:Uncharacterized protein n=1 Tax=Heracleum sosnowskyi TaxID=360622 RepID=A0AAD8GVP2_9APIA|nr:hypothetical protein POM88_048136 [Heracleum sosnowskyi]
MFSREAGHVVEECKLRVLYVSPTNPPSSATEGSEDGSSSRASYLDYASPRSFVDSLDKSSEVRTLMLKLNEEKTAAIQQGDKLLHSMRIATQRWFVGCLLDKTALIMTEQTCSEGYCRSQLNSNVTILAEVADRLATSIFRVLRSSYEW